MPRRTAGCCVGQLSIRRARIAGSKSEDLVPEPWVAQVCHLGDVARVPGRKFAGAANSVQTASLEYFDCRITGIPIN